MDLVSGEQFIKSANCLIFRLKAMTLHKLHFYLFAVECMTDSLLHTNHGPNPNTRHNLFFLLNLKYNRTENFTVIEGGCEVSLRSSSLELPGIYVKCEMLHP